MTQFQFSVSRCMADKTHQMWSHTKQKRLKAHTRRAIFIPQSPSPMMIMSVARRPHESVAERQLRLLLPEPDRKTCCASRISHTNRLSSDYINRVLGELFCLLARPRTRILALVLSLFFVFAIILMSASIDVNEVQASLSPAAQSVWLF
jgi:hypothetical protein